MSRNSQSHFATNPTNIDMSRSRFDRPFSHKTTFNVGQIIPFYVDEVLPGDTFDVETSRVVRMQSLITPVMDNIYLDMYYFFVPNSIVWAHWKEFMGVWGSIPKRPKRRRGARERDFPTRKAMPCIPMRRKLYESAGKR